MLTVACINHGNYLGRGAEYVAKLQRGIRRHLTMTCRFVVLTEQELGTDLTGWWVKMKLMNPAWFSGPVLYLDLDVVITAPIDHLVALAATEKDRLWMRDDFSYSIVHPKAGIGGEARRLLGGPGCCNSSVMLWDGPVCAPAWARWQAEKERLMGDARRPERDHRVDVAGVSTLVSRSLRNP